MRTIRLQLAACLSALAWSAAYAQDYEPSLKGADALAFSVENMDRSVDPADDFSRYAAGGWLSRIERPARVSSYGFATIVGDRINEQLKILVDRASKSAATAPKGSALQQVGTSYKAYMNVEALNAAGITPIRPELDRIAAIRSKSDLANYLGHYTRITGQWPLLEIEVFEGLENAMVNQVYVQPGHAALTLGSILEMPADAPAKQLYADYIVGMLTVAGYEAKRAKQIAIASIAIESALHKGETDPVIKVDYRNLNNPRTVAQLQAELPDFPLDTYFSALGLMPTDPLILTDTGYPAALDGVLRENSVEQIKDYLSYRLIQRFGGVLSTDFEEPGRKLNEALLGVGTLPPRDVLALSLLKASLGQPLGRLYVETFFTPDTHDKGVDMIKRLQAEFHKRIADNDWLSPSTRQEALKKVDALYYRFGIPDAWIDYSEVDISNDLVLSVMNSSRFAVARDMAKAGQPVKHWAFSDPDHTMPTAVNAAYDSSINGFEVTAGIAQPPAFEADMDAPVYYCRLGAAIGHEMTHGFDSGGRNFDSGGNMRNWWTDADAVRFDTEAQKLIAQADRYEALPGQHLNGALSVKENMADVGGLTLAYGALQSYLAEHPEENAPIDGLTPTQRCFIAWAQLWTEKSSDQAIKVQLEDHHPPGMYRTFAPLQHLDAFYRAFDIGEGDPMWLPPAQRIHAW